MFSFPSPEPLLNTTQWYFSKWLQIGVIAKDRKCSFPFSISYYTCWRLHNKQNFFELIAILILHFLVIHGTFAWKLAHLFIIVIVAWALPCNWRLSKFAGSISFKINRKRFESVIFFLISSLVFTLLLWSDQSDNRFLIFLILYEKELILF